MTMWDLADDPLAAQRAASQTAHLGVGRCFIDENQLVWMQVSLPVAPSSAVLGNVGAILLSRTQDFF